MAPKVKSSQSASLDQFVKVSNALSEVLGPGTNETAPIAGANRGAPDTDRGGSPRVRSAALSEEVASPGGTSAGGVGGSPPSSTASALGPPLEHSAALAVQSIAQSVAIGVQDASDALRDVATVQNTAIGVATAKMVETKDPAYIPIIQACLKTMEDATTYWTKVGQDGATILGSYKNLTSGK